MLISGSSIAHAASPATELGYWGYNGETVLIDEYEAGFYSMAAYYDGEIIYVITVLSDGQIEFAWAPLYGTAQSLWFTADDVATNTDGIIRAQGSGSEFMIKIKEYALDNLNNSNTVGVTSVNLTNSEVQHMRVSVNTANDYTDRDDYKALMDDLEDIYGLPYSGRNWTGFSGISSGEYYEFKEELDYEMVYRDGFAFTAVTTIGGLIAAILALYPGLTVAMTVISLALGTASSADVIIGRTGVLASFGGTVAFNRSVFINREPDPYFTCGKGIYYNGWVEEGRWGYAQLEELDTVYGPAVGGSKEMFESYELQKERAYYVYQIANN